MTTYNQHQESGIKLFEDFIHPEDLTHDFLKNHELNEGDVFIVSHSIYLVNKSRRKGLFARELNTVGLDEWYMGGGRHPRVEWNGSSAIYSSEEDQQKRPTLVPYKGKTWLLANKEIFGCLDFSKEVGEWSDGEDKNPHFGANGFGRFNANR